MASIDAVLLSEICGDWLVTTFYDCMHWPHWYDLLLLIYHATYV